MKLPGTLALALVVVVQCVAARETVCLKWGDTYSLADGKILTFKHCAHDIEMDSGYGSVQILATIQGEVILFSAKPEDLMPTLVLGGNSYINTNGCPCSNMVLCGPAEISAIVVDANVTNAKFFQLIACIEDPAQTAWEASTTIPKCAVVIPSDAAGPVEIKLESSEDMVNWDAALPGIYGSSATNRFFRVRAEHNP
jgi:hypothetical protein